MAFVSECAKAGHYPSEQHCVDAIINANNPVTVELQDPLAFNVNNPNPTLLALGPSKNNLLTYVELKPISEKIKIEKKEDKNHLCKYCNNVYEEIKQLKEHQKFHHNISDIKCTVCPMKFKTAKMLKTHTRKVHPTEKHFKCVVCSKTFETQAYLTDHWTTHTEYVTNKCNQCDKVFHNDLNLSIHLKLHETMNRLHFSDETNLQNCDVCSKKFDSLIKYKLHLRNHINEKPYSCNDCDKTFKTASHLKVHLRNHTGECPYTCTICGQGFHQKCELNSHQRTNHTGEKPFSCPYCEKTFATSSHQKVHVRGHTGERPFACTFCDRTYRQKCELTSHFKSHYKNLK